MGYLKLKPSLDKPIKIFDVDWHNTLEELNKRIKVNRERYMTDGFCSPGSGEGILEDSVKPNTIKITTCPNGFYYNGNYANIYSNDGKDLPASMSNGTYYVYLQVKEVEEPFKISGDPFTQHHIYSSFKPVVKLVSFSDGHKHNPNDGIYIGQVHIANGMARVIENNSNRKISKLRLEALPDIENKFSDMFSLGKDGKIILNTKLYKLIDIGIIEKMNNTKLYINPKHEDESKDKYNIITINNTPRKFPGDEVDLNQRELKGRIDSIDIKLFKNNKALIFAIDHNNKQAYGIYPKPVTKIKSIKSSSDNNSVVEVEEASLMNPLGVFRIYNSKGEAQVKQGLSKDSNLITLSGTIRAGFNNDAKIEQIDNFRLYRPHNGKELYEGINNTYNYAFTGYYAEVDSDGKFSFVGKYSFDNTFETDELGKIAIRDKAITTDKIDNGAITPPKLNYQYAKIWDEKSSGTDGGGTSGNDWNTRILNKQETNIDGLTLSDNIFSLPAGIYKIFATVPSYEVRIHKAALYKDDKLLILGTSEASNITGAKGSTVSIIMGLFKIDKTSSFTIRHWTSNSNAKTYGHPTSIARVSEVYTQAFIEKVG